LPYEQAEMIKDPALKDKRDIWHQALSKDVYVEEALNVLDDLQSKTISKAAISNKMKKEKLAKS
jgi:carboxyl-terminal processing protease